MSTEKLTLAQWRKDFTQPLYYDAEFNYFVVHCPTNSPARFCAVNNIEDFKVNRFGDMLLFDGPFSQLTVKTREDFLSLSFFTLCGIADTINTASIEGMVYAIEKGRIKGVLMVDSLGNFLAIE